MSFCARSLARGLDLKDKKEFSVPRGGVHVQVVCGWITREGEKREFLMTNYARSTKYLARDEKGGGNNSITVTDDAQSAFTNSEIVKIKKVFKNYVKDLKNAGMAK